MAPTDRTDYTQRLRSLANLIDDYPDLPTPYVTSFETHLDVHWYLHIHGMDLADQKATAARIVSDLGGKWDKTQDGERFNFTQTREGLTLEIAVARDAVCERVVVGTHKVTVPAIPAQPATRATTERVETVEDVEWVCGSLLSSTEVA